MKNLTSQQLTDKARQYDRIQNEGGEGYNPYTDELERRQLAEASTKPQTKQDQLNALHKKIRTECGSVAREINPPEEIDAKQTAYYAEIDKLEAEIKAEEQAAFIADWTLENTQQRRQEWNDFVRSLMDSKGQIAPQDRPSIYKREADQGWSLSNLKKAITHHKLTKKGA